MPDIERPLVLVIAFALDAAAGDPAWFPHPVRGIGFLIEKGEALFRSIFCRVYSAGRERAAGMALVISVSVITFGFFHAVLKAVRHFGAAPGFAVAVIISYLAISPRCLRDEAMKVYGKAAAGDLSGARERVSMIVGRDTGRLSMEKVIKAAVETVGESLADGVVAPLFYLAIGGPALAMLYKAINTMDSMIGYKNERYLNLGRTAAKLDDIAAWIPARIAARLLIISAAILRIDAKNAGKIYKRDRFNHASPNSGHCEAACAGALGLMLGGDAYYEGKLERKPVIGDELRQAEAFDIVRAVRLMYVSSVLFVVIAGAALAAASFIMRETPWK
ncbi:MAG: adenosylcobinamide-phosphate synthase CbiB [Spirochaetaceae bacterium]|jgi:adenosylcobinamide-phosphate synthase|nr:adenosylcobinamide-phosphate synthase CbiB [Spirochaetaceae bacterium]